MAVILEVPYRFRASGRQPRERNVLTYEAVATVPVAIPELTDAVAPIVARCRYPGLRFARDERGLISARCELETDYRAIGGRLMRRALIDPATLLNGDVGTGMHCDRIGGRLGAQATRAALDAAADSLSGAPCVDVGLAQSAMRILEIGMIGEAPNLYLRKPGASEGPGRGCYLERELPFNRRDGDDRPLWLGATRYALEQGAAFVDGILYLPSFGPGWIMDRRPRAGASCAHATPELAWGTSQVSTFRDGDEMDAVARQICAARGIEFGGVERDGAVDILVPDAVPLHPDDLALRAAAKQIVAHQDEGAVKTRNPALIRAFADVVEATVNPNSDVEAGVVALGAYAAAWDACVAADDPRRWSIELCDLVTSRAVARYELKTPVPTISRM